MTGLVAPAARPAAPPERATSVAVVAALSATTMLFASLVSAYLVRRSFADWTRPKAVAWPFVLLAFAACASAGVEVAGRSGGGTRRRGFVILLVASVLYLTGAAAVIFSIALSDGGLATPHNAFVVLLLSVHLAHAVLGVAFATWILRGSTTPTENSLLLARLVTHFLTALLVVIVFLLFVLQ